MEFKKKDRGPMNILGHLRKIQGIAAKAYGRPTSAMTTQYEVGGRPVIFIHNPQTGGTSLGQALGVKRRSHATAADRMSEKFWLKTFSIAVVRDPFSRFTSSYYGTVMPEHPINGLVKMYGPKIKTLTPFEFLELLKVEPRFGGSQLPYVSFPSKVKPYVDLILRFEEITAWPKILRSKGLDIADFSFPHANSKSKKPKNVLDILKVSESECHELRQLVNMQFSEDYEVLGYKL
jgi:hypothetical protein